MADDFFNKDEEKEEEKGEVVKIGDKEYSQEELSSLVGLGETAKEYQEKWNRPIKDFYPDYTKKSQKLAELERKAEEWEKTQAEMEKAKLEAKAQEGELSPEEARKVALKQAKEIGIVTQDEFDSAVNKAVASAMAGKQLIEDTQVAVEEAKEKYGIKTTYEDVLKYMDKEGFTNVKPEKAIKFMFEPEIDSWKEKQLKNIKPEGLETQAESTAGGKQAPEPSKLTRDNLAEAIQASLTRSRGV